MRGFSTLAVLLFGIALGACLAYLVASLRRWSQRKLLRPTLLQLDPPLARRSTHALHTSTAEPVREMVQMEPVAQVEHDRLPGNGK